MTLSYLAKLTLKLLVGVTGLDDGRRERLRTFFLAARQPDGGFRGRRGESDLYYTAFALRGLFLLGALNDKGLTQSAAAFLTRQAAKPLGAAELASLLFARSLTDFARGMEPDAGLAAWAVTQWERFRRPDGCFANSDSTPYSSTYTTFLAAVSLQAVAPEECRPGKIPIGPVLDRQRTDGGFVELTKLRQGGTNPTAAAVALLTMQGEEPRRRDAAVDFLAARQDASGGFRAGTRVPVADLLSSFTATVALADLGATARCDLRGLERFLAALNADDGGFYGAPWDRTTDVEYTFYGLALEALLAVE